MFTSLRKVTYDMSFSCIFQDFPSASQIAQILEEKSAIVIFAVMPNVYSYYERFSTLIGSAEICALEDEFSNIIKLIRNSYDVSWSKSLSPPFFLLFEARLQKSL